LNPSLLFPIVNELSLPTSLHSRTARLPFALRNRFPVPPLVLLLLAAWTAAGEPASGVRIPDDAPEYKGWAVKDVRVTGTGDLDSAIEDGLVLSGESGFLSRERATFYPAALDEDLARVLLFLARRGYPAARLDVLFHPDDETRSLEIEVKVEPGDRVRIRELRFHGFPETVDARRAAGIEPGSPFTDERAAPARRKLQRVLEEAGHAHARVDLGVVGVDSTGVVLHYRADPGPVFVFGRLTVRGVGGDLPSLVHKKIPIRRGSRYTPRVLEDAAGRLRLLDLFRRVRVDTLRSRGDTLDVIADLTEREPRSVEAGLGYWTDEQFRGHASWTHRNLLAAGRGFEAGVSGSRFEQKAAAALWWPAALGAPTRTVLRGRLIREDEEAYETVTTETELGLQYRLSVTSSIWTSITVSNVVLNVESEDVEEFRDRGGLLTFLTATWESFTGNDRLDPGHGEATNFRLEFAPPGVLTESHFLVGEGSVAIYRGALGSVFAARLHAGLGRPLDDSADLLPNRRFFSGGASSMRGFKRRRLGPLDDGGAPVGGEALLEASMEFRIPVFWRIGTGLFMDAGQVWRRAGDASWSALAVAAGPGVFVSTPIAPIRADVGFRLTDLQPDEPGAVFHLSIGHSY